MKVLTKCLLAISLSLMCMLTSVGYAAINSSMQIQGETEYSPPHAIFITLITADGTLEADTTINTYLYTVANISTRLGNDPASTSTMRVTVYNNTVDYYAFKGVLYDVGEYTYDNTNIVFDTSGLEIGAKLAPGKYATIDITFRYDSYHGVAETLNAVLDVHFGLSGQGEGTDYESYISAFLSNVKGYGLNDTKKGPEVLNNLSDHGLLYAGDNLKGGNLKHLIEAVNSTQTENLSFVYQYISDTKVILYTYEEKYNSSTYEDQTITVYKTTFSREAIGTSYSKWEASDSIKGSAEVEYLTTPGGTKLYAININSWIGVITD